MCTIRPGLGFLPALLSAVMVVAIVTTYIAATIQGDVEAFFPYISDTGVALPERCIFSQFFNIAAFLALIVMYLRYKLIRGLTNDSCHLVTRLARANLVCAFLSCLGLSFVANFQETEIYHIEAVHLTGALLLFGFGVTYAIIDTIITFHMCPTYNSSVIYKVRLTIGVIGLISLLTTVTGAVISRMQWALAPTHDHTRLHWDPNDPVSFPLDPVVVIMHEHHLKCVHFMELKKPPPKPQGFVAHLVSTFGEWTMAAAFLCYYVTFIRDFQRFTLSMEPVLLVSHLDDAPNYGSIGPAPSSQQLRQPTEPDENSHLLV